MKRVLISLIIVSLLTSMLYSCNVQENDNSLTLWLTEEQEVDLAKTIYDYKKKYPNMTITTTRTDTSDESITKMTTEIMAGKGPDIIFITPATFEDTYKTMAAGAFKNLNDFIKNDSEFDENDYYKNIMGVGQYKDMQCIFPLAFSAPLLYSSKEVLAKNDFNIDNCNTYLGYSREVAKFINKASTTAFLAPPMNSMQYNFFNIIGEAINYDEGKIDINNPDFIEAVQNFKVFYKTGLATWSKDDDYYGSNMFAPLILEGEILFDNFTTFNMPLISLYTLSRINAIDTPVVLPIPDMKGNIHAKMTLGVAINAGCKNSQAAYDFMKIILAQQADSEIKSQHGFGIVKQDFNDLVEYQKGLMGEDTLFSVDRKDNHAAKGLGNAFVDNYGNIIDSITDCSFYGGIYSIAYDAFSPYLNDKATLESCLETAQSAMEIYISE